MGQNYFIDQNVQLCYKVKNESFLHPPNLMNSMRDHRVYFRVR